ncbi:hypothetical protein BT67DRAFT_419195 [Trichocladium antarcticum]|uniref:Nudix hydrolase domain-containing protein n=1 Tax=Trichocladium antarcticum TaxID=1450529 RepID=A0AAN6UQ75_9PEZI|nr:hypothetical protein BT67DRAFT_419195 [Trichocladium antarcticum]
MGPLGATLPRCIALISRVRPILSASSPSSPRRTLYSKAGAITETDSALPIKRPFPSMPAPKQEQTPGAATVEKWEKPKKPLAPLRPSSSILLLSPTNQVLLLHRVHTSTSFASAHVFPGGNLSSFHESPLPASDSPEIHQDGLAYRLAAIRETFEESGILLARKPGQSQDQGLLQVSNEVLEAGRKQVHGNQVRFAEWLKTLGGEPDIDNLIPFTRWITPHGPPKRFTTQMYLYMLPLTGTPIPNSPQQQQQQQQTIITPTHDGGLEHTAATFDTAQNWLARARSNDIILFPPQFYLLHLVAAFLTPPSQTPTQQQQQQQQQQQKEAYQTQRAALLTFLRAAPTPPKPSSQPTDPDKTRAIPWSEKVMSPAALFVRQRDGRLVLGLDRPGTELRGSGRGGDWDRVMLVHFRKEGPRDVEVRGREEVLREEREGAAGGEGGGGSRL